MINSTEMTSDKFINKQTLNDRLSEDAHRLPDSLRKAVGRHRSTLSGLLRRYRAQFIIGITAPIWIILLRQQIDVSWTLFWSYTIYCIVFSLLNLGMYMRLRKVPTLMAFPLIEGQRALLSIDSARRWIKYAGWVLGIPVIIMIFSELAINDHEIMWGGVIGGVIGAIIGLRWELKTRRQMRSLIRAFDNTDNEE